MTWVTYLVNVNLSWWMFTPQTCCQFTSLYSSLESLPTTMKKVSFASFIPSQVHPSCSFIIEYPSSSVSPSSLPSFLIITLSYSHCHSFEPRFLISSIWMGYKWFLPNFPASNIHNSLIYSVRSYYINLPYSLIQSCPQIVYYSQCLKFLLIHLSPSLHISSSTSSSIPGPPSLQSPT